jgi:hypothetical protein
MKKDMLDIYSDCPFNSTEQTAATGLSGILEKETSHDKTTRFLSIETFDEKTLWKKVKKTVRAVETENACLIFDDTIIEKPYMDENERICWHYDHKEGRSVKGVNLLSVFYHSEKGGHTVWLPTGFRIIAKTEEYMDKKSGEAKRKSPVTKNEMMREMIKQHIEKQVKFTYVLADSWFSSAKNMRFIEKNGKEFIFELKENRLITESIKKRNEGAFERVEHAAMPEETLVKVWIKDLEFPVLLFKRVFKNKDGTTGRRFLATNNLTMTDEYFGTFYKKQWGVEGYHKNLKQNVSTGKSQAHTERTQSNYVFASIYGYIKLELLKYATKRNHFALKAKIYLFSIQTAMTSFQELWGNTQNLTFA